MAVVTCPACTAQAGSGDLICPECGANLARRPAAATARPAAMTAHPDGREPGRPTGEGATCPHCGASVPDPGNLVCLDCLRPLTTGATGIRLVFASWEVEIPAGSSQLIGRDLSSPAAATLAPHDNVSRRHVTVTVTRDGQASLTDEDSTNGTFVNDERTTPGQRVPLRDGDILRLASDVTGTIRRLPTRASPKAM
jgi:FHA domain